MLPGNLRFGLAAACLAAACRADAQPESDEATDTDSEVPAPLFIDPASGTLTIPTTRVGDLSLSVGSVVAGVTRLVIDDTDLGTLQTASAIGSLSVDALTLTISGSLVSGQHELTLRSSGGDGTLESQPVAIQVMAEQPPGLSARVDSEPIVSGTAIASCGAEAQSVLVVVDDRAEPTLLHIARVDGDQWASANMQSTRAPGLHAPTDRARPFVGGQFLPESDRLRVVWTVGSGERIDGIDVEWNTLADALPRPFLQADGALLDGVESAAFGRPWLLGDVVLAELLLAHDIENPHPGDHAIVSATIDPGGIGPTRVSQVFGVVNVDRLGPALDIAQARATNSEAVSVRVGGSRLALLDLDAESRSLRVRSDRGAFERSVLMMADGVATIVGAFGSRTAFAWSYTSPTLSVFQWSDLSPDSLRNASVEGLGGISNGSGAPAITVVGGAAVWLLPTGSDSPVIAVVSTSLEPGTQTLEDVRCDEIALPATGVGLDVGQVGLACRRGTDVFLGELRLAPN